MSGAIYPRIMRDDFKSLHPVVQQFHSIAGTHRYEGEVAIDGAVSWPGRIMAWLGRLPGTAPPSPFSFMIDATPHREIWTRHFPSRTMRSVLTADGDHLVERLGIFRLRFNLLAEKGRLRMQVLRITALGIPCPRWLFPAVIAEERGENGRFHFDIRMDVPLAGQVVRYRGHLEMPGQEVAA